MAARQQTLARRIVTAYVLMTVVVAGLFSLMVTEAVGYAEDYFAAAALTRDLDSIIMATDAGQPFQVDSDMDLFVSTNDQRGSLPAWLDGLGTGLHEIYRDGAEVHVLIRDVADKRYALVQNLAEFEYREKILKVIVLSAFALSILIAWLIGTLMARRVIAPVIRLAGQVRHREQLLPLAPALAADYASDEVGQLAAAFDETLGKLRQTLERERLFASDVSHELRTPLMVIASTCDLLLAQGIADPQQLDRIERMRASCEEMRELVEVFLQLARAPRDKGGSTNQITLGQVASEQQARWLHEAASRGLEFKLTREAEDAGLYPAPQLRAVVSNLLRNALHYTDRGFVQLVLRSGGFSVCDSGAGIPPSRREAVFQPFVRGDSSRGDGLGLGLSLVQRICRQQGWRIRLDEHAGGGCEFRVDFFGS
ncbi:MAG: HAMP domain-containing sensor histidine kinase [Rhodocyclaceae bacterium]|nr:HAMP domain-containing sensor histidine kinase [Rhodocyclaceae bacterium]